MPRLISRFVSEGGVWPAVVLVSISLALRAPFLRSFDLVSYDGTYYINQARAILTGSLGHGGAFPLGYPLLVAPLLPVFADGVRAAQVLSVIAGAASVVLAYALAADWMDRPRAFLCVLALALCPLFVRLTTMTMSESVYLFWVLLSFWWYGKDRFLLSGLAMGAAGATRPEALGIAIAVVLFSIKRPSRSALLAVGFLVPFCANSAVLSISQGRLVVLPKIQLLGSGATEWRAREASLDHSPATTPPPTRSEILRTYLGRIPPQLVILFRYLLPVAYILFIVGLVKKKGVLLAALVPLFVNPLFVPRLEPRFVLPILPFALIYAFHALDYLRPARVRPAGVWALGLSIVAGVFWNLGDLTTPVSEGFSGAKLAGLQLRGRVLPRDTIADRKPFVAFYAGCAYRELPSDPYEPTLRYLASTGVGYISLMRGMTDVYRPNLTPLLYDFTVINGELRYTQDYINSSGVLIYRRSNDVSADTPSTESIPGTAGARAPRWSPRGDLIAFAAPDGIRLTNAKGKTDSLLITGRRRFSDPAWSPDGKRLAFVTTERGNSDIHVLDLDGGEVHALVADPASDTQPDWWPDGDRISFCSNRTGEFEIHTLQLDDGRIEQLTRDGPNTSPSVAPGGDRIAWVDRGGQLVIADLASGRRLIPNAPRSIRSRPAWRPDGTLLAVEADDWGDPDVYLVRSDGSSALLLTKQPGYDATPGWGPLGNRIVTATERAGLVVVDGLAPYLARLEKPVEIRTFPRPPRP